jgi:hypothetical protein
MLQPRCWLNRPGFLFLLCPQCRLIPGPKADKYQPATQYTPSPGLTSDKKTTTTGSTPSHVPKKKQSPLSAGADEPLMHSGRNLNALVGIYSLSKAAFHRTLLRHPKYTQAYLDHAYDIVHDFRKCDIRVLHEIDPKDSVFRGLHRRTATKKLNYTIRHLRAGRSRKNKAFSKNHQRQKSNFRASWSTYQDRLQDYIQKKSLQQTMVFVMNVPRWRRQILCACTAVSVFTRCLTVAASMAIS